ncbi:MAG TPA: nicotinamide riboside transporter PnuC [Bacteroidia bacterium]|jgi:nicotinamide mononucleotide transporter|nr:nicotinamide riboside transporter PnuC [Bacteroidia bacterium]
MLSSIYSSLVSAVWQTTFIEWVIFILALVYVLLAAIENIWCWLFGILSSIFSVYLCFTGHLFLESALQVFYIGIGIYGWYEWLHGSKGAERKIISYPIFKIVYLIFIGIIIWAPLGYVAKQYSTQALPYLDACITAFSIVATWMTAKKIIQNWVFWIVIDGLAVLLYASRSFYLIALLYGIYTVLSLTGYFQWKKRIQVSFESH